MSVLDPTVPHVHAPRRALATGILIFAAFMDLVDVTIVNVALPAIRDDLHATPAHLEWVLSGYTLSFAVLLITGGRLGDNVGRRTMFLLGVGGFTAALALARASGVVATVHERHTGSLFAGMHSFPVPLPIPTFTVSLLWHPRSHADPAHRWLRGCVLDACAQPSDSSSDA